MKFVEVERQRAGKWRRSFADPQKPGVCPFCGSPDTRCWYLVWDATPLTIAKRDFVGRGFEWQWCKGCGRYSFLSCAAPPEWRSVNMMHGEPPSELKALADRFLPGSSSGP
jgi:hypothetical protein